MKTALSIVALLAFMTLASNVSAQPVIYASPAGSGSQLGIGQPQQGVIGQPQLPVPQTVPGTWPGSVPIPQTNVVNPIVQQTNGPSGILGYDLYGRPITASQSQTILESSTRPGAGIAVGQVRNVNRWEQGNGFRVHVTGQEWLGADGQWHGNLNRRTVYTNSAGGTGVHDQNIQFAPTFP